MACRVAAPVLLLTLAVVLVASPPPCAAAARVRLLADDVPRAGGEAPGYDKTDGSAAAAGSGFRGSPPEFDGGGGWQCRGAGVGGPSRAPGSGTS
ncbi:hypothetical protein C2845_PM09G02740 [Panicum miliaceum]|uniref:Uncharacterized protein n=1 Tax=Panicum miliaceum TaxID=4540 RepID=A0A3L6RX61_PANMI|nr:hypothetical protein C2845_PM09G02740 [Panicum miliaceum]